MYEHMHVHIHLYVHTAWSIAQTRNLIIIMYFAPVAQHPQNYLHHVAAWIQLAMKNRTKDDARNLGIPGLPHKMHACFGGPERLCHIDSNCRAHVVKSSIIMNLSHKSVILYEGGRTLQISLSQTSHTVRRWAHVASSHTRNPLAKVLERSSIQISTRGTGRGTGADVFIRTASICLWERLDINVTVCVREKERERLDIDASCRPWYCLHLHIHM